MPNQERNGRNVAVPDENRPSWRPQDEGQRSRRSMSDSDEHDRSTEHYGQGQSGYGSGRYEGDRSFRSRNQESMMDDPARDRGTDERFSGGAGGQPWRPMDRNEPRMQQGNYGHHGHWTDDASGGYGYDEGYGHDNRGMQGMQGNQGQGGMYGQGGYNENMYGRGGQQNRFGSQGYQGYGQQGARHSRRAIGEPRYGGAREGYGQGFGQGGIGGFGAQGMNDGFSNQDLNVSGYGQHPEHEMSFRGGQGQQQGYGQQGYGQQGNRSQQSYGQQQGVHRGKGPAGYTRSDDRIREMVCDVLTDHDHIDASTIEITVKNGEVTLAGTVDDRRTKRMAEDVIENLSGVKEVVNQLRVADRTSSSSQRTGGSAVEKSGREQELQSTSSSDKRHRA